MRSGFIGFIVFLGFCILVSSFTISNSRVSKNILITTDTSYPSFDKALDHKGKTIVSNNELINFSSGLDNDLYRGDTISRHCYLYLETVVKNLPVDSLKRIPLNISIVIDRSGSMKGEKMDRAIDAAKNIVDKLSETDIVSIIAYGDDVDVIQQAIPVINKSKIKEKIAGIMPRGGTNLWGGCETGYYQVIEKAKPGYINHVFLISDGLANVGVTSSKSIKANVQRYKDEERISLSCFGVGLDFNEVLLNEMAETGSGNYYFIEEPGKIMGILEAELNSLLHIAARDALLTLYFPRGVKPEKMTSFNYTVNDQIISIKFLDLKEGEVKHVLMNLRISDTVKSLLPFRSVLTYSDARTEQKRQLENSNFLIPAPYKQYLAGFNKDVISSVLLNAAAENLDAMISEVDKYNYGGATKILEQNRRLLAKHENYVNDYNALKQIDTASKQYEAYLPAMRSLTSDSMRLIQKSSRAMLYMIRNK